MNIRNGFPWVLLGLSACAPDYLDLGYDLPTTTTVKVCTPGEARACYSGPAGTQSTGICKGGTQTCVTDGKSFGPCLGEVLPKPVEDCVTPEDDDCDGLAPVCDGKPIWAYRAGDTAQQTVRTLSSRTIGGGLLAGRFLGTLDLGADLPPLESDGGPNLFLVRLSGKGLADWGVRFGGQGTTDIDGRAAEVPGGGAVTGGHFSGSLQLIGGEPAVLSAGSYDLFVAKLDDTGKVAWARTFGDSAAQRLQAVAVGPNGEIAIAGTFDGKIDFAPAGMLAHKGTEDLFVAVLSPTATPVWARGFGATQGTLVRLVFDDAANLLVAGQFGGILDFDGALPALSSADPAVDAFVVKLDKTGTPVWARSFGDDQPQGCQAVATDSAGGVLIGGYFDGQLQIGGDQQTLSSAGGADAFVASLDSTGTTRWARRFGDDQHQECTGVAADAAGNILTAGMFRGTIEPGNGGKSLVSSAGSTDVFAMKLDNQGTTLWAQRFGDEQEQQCTGLGVDATGNAIVAGSFDGVIDPGNGLSPLSSAGNLDVFALEVAP